MPFPEGTTTYSPMRVSLQTLRYFVAVMAEGSIASAARKENISPSAISKRIADIEAHLGATLFRRTAKGLVPTPPALAMLRHANRVLREVQVIESDASEYAKGFKGNIRIASTMSAICQHLPNQLRNFSRMYPGVRFQVDELNSGDILKSLRDEEHDIGFFFWEREEDDMDMVPYVVDQLVVIAPKDHRIAGIDALYFAELLEYDFVGLRIGSDLERRLVSEARQQCQQLNIRMRVGAFDSTFQLVEAGLGISVVPRSYLRSSDHTDRVCAVGLLDAWANRQVWMATPKGAHVSGTTQLFMDVIQSGSDTGQVDISGSYPR